MLTKPLKLGKTERQSYGKIGDNAEMPHLLEVQKSSYDWFVEEGLQEVFEEFSNITDFSGNLILRFTHTAFDREKTKHDIEECRLRDTTYSAPLKVGVQLINRETGEIKEQEIFMGNFPVMTPKGSFIINGAERVIVNQLVRSPGVYYAMEYDKHGTELYSSTVIPNRGAWLEYELDSNNICHIKVDRGRKFPLTSFLRAQGLSTDEDIKSVFGQSECLFSTMVKDAATNQEEGLIEVYKRLRPGEEGAAHAAQSLLNSMFFDPKRYDVAKVGRYKYNIKLGITGRIAEHIAASNIVSPLTGKTIVKRGEKITIAQARQCDEEDVLEVLLEGKEYDVKVFTNKMVHLSNYVSSKVLEAVNIKEKVYKPLLDEILANCKNDKELIKELIAQKNELVPRYLTLDDMFASVNYQLNLIEGIGKVDDIDHLGNRRIRSVGELLQNQFRVGLTRLERVVRERMTIQDLDSVTPQTLINIRPVIAAIKEFFGSSQLSQFMDQTNPLTEITHKRRLSALGPGGLSRERAGYEVRDVHYTHYGRMCPIETPEGPNVGLINSLATFARINEYGFIEAPFRKVDKKTHSVTDEVIYMTADVEDNYIVAQANEPLDDKNRFTHKAVTSRYLDRIIETAPENIDFMDVSPKQVVSLATAMIPFLENDDANRALMGSNMQRQAVPLLKTENPIVGTGIEYKAGHDSGVCVLAEEDGVVQKLCSEYIDIKGKNGVKRYDLLKFALSNQGTCNNHKPIVEVGEKVKAGDVIADGPSTANGELALGKNILIGFMTWEGYNYEDAILISEKIVKEDVFTTIHIDEHEAEARDTKLGLEEITRDIPGVGEEALKNLDEHGVIRIGAEVKDGDILVGKVTPKGESDLTPEERLLRAIFGEKAREVRDTSYRVPHGEGGIVVDVKVFTRENNDELPTGVQTSVRVYIAQKRKISVGDKMAGRHGNKGVVSRILPEEDMPFLPDGTPLQVVLNPLGVPSRMNIGQVLEVHLGYAAKALGWQIATPVFDGATENDIIETLEMAGLEKDGKSVLYDGRTGEPFDNRVTVGYMYMLKLHHLVDDKIHARSTGPYSLVTQQPLGGKAQFGGQRFGEMEVWALEAYGAAHTLQEILTVKSDDVQGRSHTYEAIVKGENIPSAGIPESFKVLMKEMQSLALDVKITDSHGNEVEIGTEESRQASEYKDDLPDISHLLNQVDVSAVTDEPIEEDTDLDEVVNEILEVASEIEE